MGNWRLTAKENLSSPHGGKNLRKGFTIVVGGQSTTTIGGPSMDEVRGALINVGFSLDEAERYVSSSPNANFNCEYCGDLDWNLVRDQTEALKSARDEKWEEQRKSANEAYEQRKQTNGSSAKGGLFGNLLSVAVGIAAAVSQSESGKSNEKKSGGLFGVAKKSEPEKKTGGLFGVAKKTEPEKKSGGLFGGDNSKKTKSSGSMIGNGSKSRGMSSGIGGKKRR